MKMLQALVCFGLRHVAGETAANMTEKVLDIATGEAVIDVAGKSIAFLVTRFTDRSLALPKAVAKANERTWNALGIALADDGFWDKCQRFVGADRTNREIRAQVEPFLRAAALDQLPTEFRAACRADLQRLRESADFKDGHLSQADLNRGLQSWQRYGDPAGVVGGAWAAVNAVAQALDLGYPNLAKLLRHRNGDAPPLLASLFAFFLREEIAKAKNEELSRALTFDLLRNLYAKQETAFAGIGQALDAIGDKLDAILGELADIKAIGQQTLLAVETLRLEIQQVASRNHIPAGAVPSRLVISITSEKEQTVLRRLRDEYRKLPVAVQNADDNLRLCDALSAAGLLDLARASSEDAGRLAAEAKDRAQEAEAHYKTYHVACEQEKYEDALPFLLRAAKLDAPRFEPFPLAQYKPERILGAGGFGTVFLCADVYANRRQVAIKTLHTADLDRRIEDVFAEAHRLQDLNHPSIIRVWHWSFADAAQTRPYLVMDYFTGDSLQNYVKKHGPLPSEDLVALARLLAHAMNAAHQQDVLHRDLKPDNILVRKEGGQWFVKIIDWGLAVQQSAVRTSVANPPNRRTVRDKSFTGSFKYAPPEQKGELLDVAGQPVAVGRYSDVFTFGKTLCEAGFQTTEPRSWDFEGLPAAYRPLGQLLERCVATPLRYRPTDFGPVLEVLEALSAVKQESNSEPVAPEAAKQQRREEMALAAEQVRLEKEKVARRDEQKKQEAAERRRKEEQERQQRELADQETNKAANNTWKPRNCAQEQEAAERKRPEELAQADERLHRSKEEAAQLELPSLEVRRTTEILKALLVSGCLLLAFLALIVCMGAFFSR